MINLSVENLKKKSIPLNSKFKLEEKVKLEIIVNSDWRTYPDISFKYAKYIVNNYNHSGYLIVLK